MKYYIFLTLSICSFGLLQAQKKQSVNTTQYVITASHVSNTSGLTHTYTRQTIDGIEVYGTESSFHTTSTGETLRENNNYLKKIEDFTFSKSASLSPAQAIASVADQMNYGAPKKLQIVTPVNEHKKTVFSNSGISKRNIPVKFAYHYSVEQGIKSVYELSILQLDTQHWYNFFVDANSGDIITKIDWMSSCALLDDNHDSHNHEVLLSKNISEEKKLNSFIGPVNNTMMAGNYNVYPLPVESPNHGSRSIVSNPENLTASPFGWHDTNGVAGAEFTTTQGNNVRAYDDGDGTDSPSNNNDFAEGGAGLSFNFSLNSD